MLDDSHTVKIAGGDYAAFRVLHDRLSEQLYYYAYKRTGNQAASEDLLQEAFIIYWEHRANFSSLIAVKAYLFTTLRYLISNYTKVQANRQRIVGNLEFDEVVTEEHLLISAEVGALVRRAISELPPHIEKVIELSISDYTVEMIAKELNMSPNTVKALKKSGYKLLREKLGHLRPFLLFLFVS